MHGCQIKILLFDDCHFIMHVYSVLHGFVVHDENKLSDWFPSSANFVTFFCLFIDLAFGSLSP